MVAVWVTKQIDANNWVVTMLVVYQLCEKVIHLICIDVELHPVIYRDIFENVQAIHVFWVVRIYQSITLQKGGQCHAQNIESNDKVFIISHLLPLVIPVTIGVMFITSVCFSNTVQMAS